MATIIGTTGNETLDGTADGDTILALGGEDLVNAGDGDDLILLGSGGNDSVDGGDGIDTLVLTGSFSDYTITSFTASSLQLTVGPTVETITNVELVIFDDAAVRVVGGGGQYQTIQSAIDAASDGETILIAPGTYTENIVVNKAVNLIGGGAPGDVVIQGSFTTDNPVTTTVTDFLETAGSYTGAAGNGITVAADDVSISNLTVSGFLTAIELGSNDGLTITDVDITESVNGVRKGTAAVVNNFEMTGGTISDTYIGIYIGAAVGAGAFDGVNIDGVTFSDLGEKGIYAEQLSNAVITNITMNDVGQFGRGPAFGPASQTGEFGNGIDINLKYGAYSNIVISDFDFTNVGLSGGVDTVPLDFGAAITIKARDDAPSYSTNTATLDGVTIENGTIDGTSTGIRIGEPGKTNAGPTNVVVNNVAIDNDTVADFDNATTATLEVNGTSGNDDIDVSPGATGPVEINGGDGNDDMTGGGGGDTLVGGSGDDTMDGGAGSDTAVYSGNTADYGLAVAGGTVTITDNNAGDGDDGVDTLSNVETVAFADSSVFIVGAGGFSTIQAAINAASAGDTIIVAAGTYAENVTINKDVTLLGANAGTSATDTRAAESIVQGVITFAADGATIDGFTIDGGGTQGSGIRTSSGMTVRNDIDIANNILTGQTGQAILHGFGQGGGIGSSNWSITGNLITNITGNNATAIVVFNIDDLTVTDNTVEHTNGVTGKRGINLDGIQNGTISGNSLDMGGPETGTNWGIQISMSDREAEDLTVTDNTVTNARDGIVGLSQRSLVNVDITNNDLSAVTNGIVINGGSTPPQAANATMDVAITGNIIATAAPTGYAVFIRDLHDEAPNGPVVFENLDVTGNSVSQGVLQVGRAETFIPAGATGPGNGLLNVDGTITLDGTDNNDVVQVEGSGAVTFEGNDGSDTFIGGDGADTANGGAGNDSLAGGAGTDAIDGGAGDDTIVYGSGAELTSGETVDGGDDTDTILFNPSSADTLTITTNVTNVEAVTIGGTEAGSVDASAAVNGLSITGNDAANTLTGSADADSLDGGDGDDTLVGGTGNDDIDGGAGFDDADYAGAVADYDISTDGTNITVTDNNAGDGDDGSDTIANVERIDFADQSVLVVGTGGFASIQAAINAASDGDSILVLDGVYTENVNVNKAVNIITSNSGVAGSDGGRDAAAGSGEATITGTVTITAAGAVTLDGLRFLNSVAGGNTVSINTGHDHQILNSVFYSTVSGGGSGDRAISMGVLATGNVTISGNYITGSATGLFSTASWDRGLWTDGGGVDVTISNNIFEYTRTAINADASAPSLIAITDNTINAAGSGISLGINYTNVTITGTSLENVGTEFNLRNLAVDVTFDASGAITALNTGFGGNDLVVILGGNGNDTLTGTDFGDVIDGNNLNVSNADNDILSGGDGDDTLLGRAGDDSLDGGTGADTMDGGDGNDTYTVDDAGDAVTDSSGTDEIRTSLNSYSIDGTSIENLTYIGSSRFVGIGSAVDNVITGGDGRDTINGRSGNDTMIGGDENDLYVVNAVGDVLVEAVGEGTDQVRSSNLSLDLNSYANVENATLSGSRDLSITGDAGANILRGNIGSNVITGGGGADVMYGGDGNDVFRYTSITDSGFGLDRDQISDFVQGQDLIDLFAIDAKQAAAFNNAFVWIGAASFSGLGAALESFRQ